MADPVMKILYGPPGTGKTWRAAREAVKAVDPSSYKDALSQKDPDEAIRTLHTKLEKDGRILWVTFHPGYSYEDFIEGYRPIVNELGQLIYRVVDGPFKILCNRAKFEDDIQIGERLTDASGYPAGTVIDKDAGGWIVRVTATRTDKIATSIDKYVPRFVVERLVKYGFDPQIFSIPGKPILPLADYGIDPSDEDVGPPEGEETEANRSGATIRRIIAARTGMFSSSDLSNAAHIGSVIRRLKVLRATSTTKETPVALVIDEINRAEPSRVFGELITLLERDKREGKPDEKKVWLPYSKELFTVPLTVSVIGTMNTVDRSLTSLDFAMRRRFEFELVAPEVELLSASYAGVDVRGLLRRVNSRVNAILGKGYEFGHAFLMPGKLEEIKQLHNWAESADGDLRALASVMRVNLLPTLAEYLHDDWARINAVAGEAKSGTEVISLFEKSTVDPAFTERLPDEYEIPENQIIGYADWWDPENSAWDADKFRRFIVALVSGH